MSDTSIYSKLTEKELLSSMPAAANLFAEVNGETKRVPGYAMDIYAKKEDLESLSSLPSGSSPNQYLVTDGEGVAGWADRTHWVDEQRTYYGYGEDVIPAGTNAQRAGELLNLHGNYNDEPPGYLGEDRVGESIWVEFDGVIYELEVESASETASPYGVWLGFGNVPGMFDHPDVPFGFKTYRDGYETYFYVEDDSVEHTVYIFDKKTEVHPISDDLIPSTIARTADIPEVVQPDWNAAEGEPGHVLNRTHWVEEGTVIVLPEATDHCAESSGAYPSTGDIGNPSEPIVAGETYIVTVNGVTVETTFSENRIYSGCFMSDKNINGTTIGYDPDCANGLSNTECFVTYVDVAGDYTVKIEKRATVAHPLPPSLGGMPTLAEDGSDAGKTVKANAEGTGYELVAESGGSGFDAVFTVEEIYDDSGAVVESYTITPEDGFDFASFHEKFTDKHSLPNVLVIIGKKRERNIGYRSYAWDEENGYSDTIFFCSGSVNCEGAPDYSWIPADAE